MRKIIFFLFFTTLLFGVQNDANMRKLAEKQLEKNDPKGYEVYKKKMLQARDDLRWQKRTRVKILYLTSHSVPADHFIKLAKEAANSGLDVEIQPIMRGFGASNNLLVLLEGYRKSMELLGEADREKVVKIGVPMKMAPKLFDDLNAKMAPLIAVSKCIDSKPTLENCSVKFIATGATTLSAMAEKAGVGDSAQELIKAAYDN